jgi:hypothetical protein
MRVVPTSHLVRAFVAVSLFVGCAEPEEFPCVRTSGTSTCSGCEPGFHLEGATCVPSPTLTIAALPVEVLADGVTTVAIQITGRNVDGSPLTEPVTVALSRQGAGSLSTDTITLDAAGSTVTYSPCDSDLGSCLGDLWVTVSLARARQVSANAEINLVAPPLLSRCAGTGNVLYLRGAEGSYVLEGAVTVRDATWTNGQGGPEGGQFLIDPTDSPLPWHVFIFAPEGMSLSPGVYTDARRFEDATHPGLDVSGQGRGCNQTFGEFEIVEFASKVDRVTRLVATFKQHCEQPTRPELRGCVRFQRATIATAPGRDRGRALAGRRWWRRAGPPGGAWPGVDARRARSPVPPG